MLITTIIVVATSAVLLYLKSYIIEKESFNAELWLFDWCLLAHRTNWVIDLFNSTGLLVSTYSIKLHWAEHKRLICYTPTEYLVLEREKEFQVCL